MDIETYKVKIRAFAACFAMLNIPKHLKKEIFKEGQFQGAKDELVMSLRKLLADESFVSPALVIPIPVEMLKTINAVNLVADIEAITQQAEAVKQEIIKVGNLFSSLIRNIKVPSGETFLTQGSGGTADISGVYKITDFIRDPSGKKVYPFEFWHDCIEVYLMKHAYGHSNGKIAKECKFKTSVAALGRQRQQVVAEMLAETERLIKAVSMNQFPPLILKGTKQPTMINEEA